MTYKNYLALVGECKNYDTADAILAEYGYPADCEWTAAGLAKAFDIIFVVSRLDITKLIEIGGGNLSAFGRTYNIPRRSLQNWAAGVRKAPEYVIQLIGYTLISECEKE